MQRIACACVGEINYSVPHLKLPEVTLSTFRLIMGIAFSHSTFISVCMVFIHFQLWAEIGHIQFLLQTYNQASRVKSSEVCQMHAQHDWESFNLAIWLEVCVGKRPYIFQPRAKIYMCCCIPVLVHSKKNSINLYIQAYKHTTGMIRH